MGEYTDVQDQLVLVSGVVTGFYKVRRGDTEGWVKTSAVVPILAEQSALKASGMTCEVGDEVPGELDVEEGELWEYGMVCLALSTASAVVVTTCRPLCRYCVTATRFSISVSKARTNVPGG